MRCTRPDSIVPPRRALAAFVSLMATLCMGTGCTEPPTTQPPADVVFGDATDGSGTEDASGEGIPVDAIFTGPNDPPGPAEIHLEPTVATTGDALEVVIDLEAVDPDSQPLAVTYITRWYKDDVLTPNSGLLLPSNQTRRGETWRVEVAAFDGQDEGPAVEASVLIANSAPTLTHASLKPVAPTTDDVLVCDLGQLADADGDDVSVTYAWFRGGLPISGATAAGLQPPHDAGVTYQCSVAPFDGELAGEVKGSNIETPVAVVTSDSLISNSPTALDLGTVLPGESAQLDLTISNIGEADLTIASAQIDPESDPGFVFDGSIFPQTIAPGEDVVVQVGFSTDSPGLFKGSLLIESDAKNKPSKSVPLLGVGASPCLLLDPPTVDFGGAYPPANVKLPLTLRSCGDLPVNIDAIAMVNPSGAPFEVDLAPLLAPVPFTLEPGEEVFFNVAFKPQTASPTDAQGLPIPETATVAVTTNAPMPTKEVTVSGFASPGGCPVAIPHVVGGSKAIPGATLNLSAGMSFGAFGVPSLVSWSVSSLPNGEVASAVLPTADVHDVTYTLGGAGTYTFQLNVFDEANAAGLACGEPGNPCTQVIPGCSPGFVTVEVVDAVPLIVELTWDTPGDANQGDTGAGLGADLDIHMHNGAGVGDDYDADGAPDSWFDIVADCFWLDASPDWGAAGGDDDPMLALEDADGQGPERIEFHQPKAGDTYTFGAHYWSDYGYGSSIATLKVYVFEELVWQSNPAVLESGDLFEAGTVAWPSGIVTPAIGNEGGPKVTPNYPNPFF